MRRGLLSWNRDEVPPEVLDARLERCRAAMRDADLPCLLVYTSFPRPAAVSWLTHFVPYWSQGVLAVLPDQPPVLIVSLSKRVAEWIASTAHVGDIVCTPDPGAAAAKLFHQHCPGAGRIGIVELGSFPGGIARSLAAALPGVEPVDATAAFAAARNPADVTEIALAGRAAAIAAESLESGVAAADGDSGRLIAAIEHHARLAAAEEVMIRVAPDLKRSTQFERIEGAAALGARYAVQASVAYKGHWVRLGRAVGAPEGWEDARDRAVAALRAGAPPRGSLDGAALWCVEGCTGTRPLAALAASGAPDGADLPAGGVCTLTVGLDLAGTSWPVSEPVVLGTGADPARRLLAD